MFTILFLVFMFKYFSVGKLKDFGLLIFYLFESSLGLEQVENIRTGSGFRVLIMSKYWIRTV